MKEADAALICALDTDGNGKISLAEFVELSTVTGLGRFNMRARFRDKDLGNSGELTIEQMREVLQELRDDVSKGRVAASGSMGVVVGARGNESGATSSQRRPRERSQTTLTLANAAAQAGVF